MFGDSIVLTTSFLFKEIMFPAMPTDVAVSDDGNLLVYSDTHIDVFDTNTGDWVQTINIRKTRPLIKTGALNLSMLQELPHITYLCSYQGTLNDIKMLPEFSEYSVSIISKVAS